MRYLQTRYQRRALSVGSLCALGFSISRIFGDASPTTQPATLPVAITSPPPTTAPISTSVDVDRLINQLGSDNADERDSAQKQLVDVGSAAIPALKKAAENNTDPEIRSRAAAAMAQMKDHELNDASLITLHLSDAPAQEVLDAISNQSHAQITSFAVDRIMGTDHRGVTIDADRKPFWEVMSDICGQLNACPILDVSGKGQLRVMPQPRNWMLSPHSVVGPVWLSVAGIYRTRSIDLMGTPSVDDQFTVRLIVFPEPKLAVAQILNLALTEATDDAGHSLLPKPLALNAAQIVGRNQAPMNRMVETRLDYPEHPGSRIAILRGEVDVSMGADIQQYVIDDVLGAKKVTNPLKNCTVNIAIGKAATNLESYHVNLECTRDGLSDEQWGAMVSRLNDLNLEDADGHQLTPLSRMMGSPSTSTTLKTILYFSTNPVSPFGGRAAGPAAGAPAVKIGEPKKLIWNVATSLKSMKIPVLFKDLPMP